MRPPSRRSAFAKEAIMGLMDILNGMQNGPRGGASRAGGGGMSPVTMALLGLLAYKAVKSFSGSSADPANPAAGRAAPGTAPGAAEGGGLGGLLGGLMGGGGSAAAAGGLGGILSGGLGDLLDQFRGAGKGDVAGSWVAPGQNKPIAPHELSQVLTTEQIDFLTQRTGMSREDLLAGLSEQLPEVVNSLTPAGRLPTSDEMHRIV
jgi:uncharacterized protein YidB (DUF937 family)